MHARSVEAQSLLEQGTEEAARKAAELDDLPADPVAAVAALDGYEWSSAEAADLHAQAKELAATLPTG